jgi:hypothetical protein
MKDLHATFETDRLWMKYEALQKAKLMLNSTVEAIAAIPMDEGIVLELYNETKKLQIIVGGYMDIARTQYEKLTGSHQMTEKAE